MDLNAFFPTIVGSIRNPDHNLLEQDLTNHCLTLRKNVISGGDGWLSNKTFNTSDGRYDLHADTKFKKINSWVESQFKEYCNLLDIETDIWQNTGAWLNIYEKYDFQENHVHPTSTLSGIYLLCNSLGGARIFLNSPINNMYYNRKKTKRQEMADKIIVNPKPGTLIIFPSYLNHAVERHDIDDIRISLSYNFRNF